MVGIMIHHIHGSGFSPVKGSISVEKLEKTIEKYAKTHIFTFDDRLASQELAIDVLDKKGIQGWFFVVHHNEMEQDRITRESSPDFHGWFMSEYLKNYPYPNMPEDFLSAYPFYTQKEKEYRYIRDVLNPFGHDEIMRPHRRDVALLDLDKIRHHKIGLHSHSHPRRMSHLNAFEQYTEYQLCCDLVGETDCMSHPMGDYNDTTLEILKAMGIKYGFRSDDKFFSNLELPRIDICTL